MGVLCWPLSHPHGADNEIGDLHVDMLPRVTAGSSLHMFLSHCSTFNRQYAV